MADDPHDMSTDDDASQTLGPLARAVIHDEILEAIGLTNLSETEKAELYQTMIATIQDRVLARILDTLDESAQAQLTQLLDRSSPDRLDPFLAAHVPNLDELMTQEALLYKAELIESAGQIRTALGVRTGSTAA